ncbi:hypothetical protein PR048_023359 [Dryococelus australis]|uniref:Uncharacterized protein n=1 Tax=Dryococelus australis TaxID=614101 RepID=A0ABQ9GTV6_9NEOP|nr:hypothetical protein PR048_023359 [Dryococelus australis]
MKIGKKEIRNHRRPRNVRTISLQSANLSLHLRHKILGISHAMQTTVQYLRIEHALYFCAIPCKLRGTSNVIGHSGAHVSSLIVLLNCAV